MNLHDDKCLKQRCSVCCTDLKERKQNQGICQLSVWSWISHRFSWSSLAHSSESTSCALRDGSSLAKPPRLVLEVVTPAFPPTPTSGFFGFLASPASRNSKKRLMRFGPRHNSEPSRRLRGTSNIVSRRLKDAQQSRVRFNYV